MSHNFHAILAREGIEERALTSTTTIHCAPSGGIPRGNKIHHTDLLPSKFYPITMNANVMTIISNFKTISNSNS